MTENEIPNCPQCSGCHCYPEEEKAANLAGGTHCICGDTEKALRRWANGSLIVPMTKEQRDWCLEEIDGVEGYSKADYQNDSDGELARIVLTAWSDYCREKGLL